MYLLFSSFLLFAQGNSIYFYFDDGGEHDYLEKCQKWTGTQKQWSLIQNKLTQPDLKKSFLGKNFIAGELTNTVEYYFNNEKSCNSSLKKASKWSEKEFKEIKPRK